MAATLFACAPDGSAIAMRLDPMLVIVMSMPQRDTIGQAHYLRPDALGKEMALLEQHVGGSLMSFVPQVVGVGVTRAGCAIGLDGGEGNFWFHGKRPLCRSDAHPGRPLRRWLVKF